MPNQILNCDTPMTPGAEALYESRKLAVYKRTDLLFTLLIVFEWVASMVVALVVSPLAWAGRDSYIHPHILVAVILGICHVFPVVYLYKTRAGKPITRHVIAFTQIFYSALLIHLTGGRIETHFHVFGSLAFLAFYRDWRVFITAVTLVALDHVIRGIYVPESVYGVLTASPWRTVEHAGWVVFETIFLIKSCKQQQAEMRALCIQQDALETANKQISELADQRGRDLDHSKKYLSAIVESSFDAIIGIDEDCTITTWNSGAMDLYGYTSEQAIGESVLMIVPPELHEEFIAHVDEVVHGELVAEKETLRLRKDGSTVHIEVTISPIYKETGVIGISLIERDISDRKAVEKRMSEFYSTVSHELRTPLTSIRGALSVIDDEIVEIDSEESREMIQLARSSSERLVRLINDILDLRKIEAGKMELHLEQMDSSTLVSLGMDAMAGMALDKNINIESNIESNVLVSVDRDRITQVLCNLLSNAIKFSPVDGCILISACVVESGSLRISVTDEGEGIPFEMQSALFGKFQQVDSSDARAKEGTGLGLAISKAIIEQHKGIIGMNSRCGFGSTFWFELPSKSPSVSCQNLNNGGRRMDILIVEDDENFAHLLKLCLAKKGFSTRHASTLGAASKMIKEHKPMVVLLDVLLPDGNGVDWLNQVKKDGELEDVPVVVISGDDRDNYSFSQPFIYEWLPKPLDFSRLFELVKNLLRDTKKVLVVEDDSDARAVILAKLKNLNAICIEASNGKSAIELAKSNAPDLVILDIGLPQMNGFDVVSALNTENISCNLLVYSGLDISPEEQALLKHGLTRYITKGSVHAREFIILVEELIGSVLENGEVDVGENVEDQVLNK